MSRNINRKVINNNNNNNKIGEAILANTGFNFGIFGTNVCKEEDKGWFCQLQRFFSIIFMIIFLLILIFVIYYVIKYLLGNSKSTKILNKNK